MKDPLNKLEMDIFIRNVHFQFIQRAQHTASVDSNILCKIRHFMCFNVHGAAG